jgi:DNA polymerase-3 subunit delta'
MSAERDEKEKADLEIALGKGGTGKGTAGAVRGSAGALKELERRQKSRATRTGRDALDRALIDLAGAYRDALTVSFGSSAPLTHPDRATETAELAQRADATDLLRAIEAVLACREALAVNVKPRFAVAAMAAALIKHTGMVR